MSSTAFLAIANPSVKVSPARAAGISAIVNGPSRKTFLADSRVPNSGPRSPNGSNTWPYLPTVRSPGTTGRVCRTPTPCF